MIDPENDTILKACNRWSKPGPKRSFQHNVMTALRNFAVDKETWEESARHRKSWKNLISKDGLKYCMDRWLDERKLKRAARHSKIAAKAAVAKEADEGVGAPTTYDVICSDAAATVRKAHGAEPAGAEHHSHNEESEGGSEVTTDNEDVSYSGAEAFSDSASSEDENTHNDAPGHPHSQLSCCQCFRPAPKRY